MSADQSERSQAAGNFISCARFGGLHVYVVHALLNFIPEDLTVSINVFPYCARNTPSRDFENTLQRLPAC